MINLLQELSPVLIPIIALLIPIVGIIAWAAVRITRLKLMHETVRHLSASGQPIPQELLHKISGGKD